MATLLFSKKKDQTDQARQVQNQSKQTKQTNPDSSVCSLDLPLDFETNHPLSRRNPKL
jgi:hypothetical protein